MRWYPEKCDLKRLDLLLRERLPEKGQRELEGHLLVCPACRDRLDELAGGPRWWTEVRRFLGGDGASELLSVSTPPDSRIPLDFLEPSTNPASLGRLNAYEVLEVIGRGGMGVVLRAFDAALHRPVAIKVLAPEYAANGAARKRFAREAQAAAAVIHDHVVPVHAVDAEATPPYMVMAYIPGRSLQERIERCGPLELKEILRIGMQTAAGLAAAHAQGLVHRDIKPANIMLENGVERVRITDFGLARAVDDASVTQAGVLAGTPQYMAPEQGRGEVVDQRADLFALGSTLYAMCTGRAPFRGDCGMAVIRQVCDAEPTPIISLNSDIPVWLEGIVRKLHAKDPALRFASAGEVADLLERCLAHVQQPDRQPLPLLAEELGRSVLGSAPPRLRRWWWAAVVAAGILGMTALFFGMRSPGERVIVGTSESESLDPASLEHLDEDSTQLRTRVNLLSESFVPPSSSNLGCVEPTLENVRERIGMLEREWSTFEEASSDSMDAEIQVIRRRLEQVKRSLGAGPP